MALNARLERLIRARQVHHCTTGVVGGHTKDTSDARDEREKLQANPKWRSIISA
jgi:hypothetical protein